MMSRAKVCRKELFSIPDGMIYLDGNSLGPLPKSVVAHVGNMLEAQWGHHLIQGWNACGWMEQPSRVGNMVGRLIGAPEGSVVMGDTLSIKVYQALAAALQMRPDRKVVLSDSGNFPTDLYMARGLIDALQQGHTLKIVEPEAVCDEIDATVAAVMLTQVDYRTGRRHDMKSITDAAQRAGAVMIWDLAHSAGAIDVDLTASNCEFAVGCTYKYLNGGPGAPAYIYIRPDLITEVEPILAGWLGHDAPFAFDLDYRPAPGIDRMRIGTPPVIQMAALEQALTVWEGVPVSEVEAASANLSDLFIREAEARCPDLELISPRAARKRGSQVSFAFENGYAAIQALIARGVIGDFRAPNVMRFGFTPLYVDEIDVLSAVDHLADVINNKLWDRSEFKTPKRVT